MNQKLRLTKPIKSLRPVKLPAGLPTPEEIHTELQQMFDVLIGRSPAPLNRDTLDLMEIADAFYMRATELTFIIHALEREGKVKRGEVYYKVRTGELEDFRDACKRAVELGSRRLTAMQLEQNQITRGLSSEGHEK